MTLQRLSPLLLASACLVLLVPERNASADPPPDALARAQEIGDAFTSVAERVSPAVVHIQVEARRAARRLPFRVPGQSPGGLARGNGSGVIIDSNGLILTNNHVVENATWMQVRLRDGREFPAEIVGRDPATDLAVIRIQETGLPAAPFASANAIRVGQWAVAIGSPFGLAYSVTTGVVSALGRGVGMNEIEDYIQTDASINPGNSGGPLVNLEGQILGINTMIAGRGTGIGFAVPCDIAERVAAQIIEHGEVRRAWIGVGYQELTPELASHFSTGSARLEGALINRIEPNGPAARAGLEPGDVVVSVADHAVTDGRSLLRSVMMEDVGSTMQLVVIRRGSTLRLSLTTTERPSAGGASPQSPGAASPTPASSRGGFGLQLRDLSPDAARRMDRNPGVLVTGVTPGSPAARSGIRQGDVVVSADHKAVLTVRALEQELRDGVALLRLERERSAYFATVRRPSRR